MENNEMRENETDIEEVNSNVNEPTTVIEEVIPEEMRSEGSVSENEVTENATEEVPIPNLSVPNNAGDGVTTGTVTAQAQKEISAQKKNVKQARYVKQIGPLYASMLRDNKKFVIGCFVYALIFTTCMYPGIRTIMIPIISAVTIVGLVLLMKHWDKEITKRDIVYFAIWFLLGVSNALTRSEWLTFYNCCGMALLFISFMLNHFVDTSDWGFTKYFIEILSGFVMPMGYIGKPFHEIRRFFEKKDDGNSNKKGKYVWLGILIAIPFLVVIIVLLSQADAVFKEALGKILEYIRLPEHPIRMVLVFFIGMIMSYATVAYYADEVIKKDFPEFKKWESVVGITFLSLLSVVYILFCAIQVSYLFVGGFTLPDGYTYAKYAREGYFQLLAVCIINLVILLVFIAKFEMRRVLKVIMTIFSACTYIMLASSMVRLVMYVRYFQLSFRRVFTIWSLIVIAVVLVGLMICIWKEDFRLFRYTTMVVAVGYVILSLARPDAVIARYNLAHDSVQSPVDREYLVENLSEDAIPAIYDFGELKTHPDAYKRYEYTKAFREYKEMEPLEFNFSLNRAGKILKETLYADEEID